jgi:hypothetical protein
MRQFRLWPSVIITLLVLSGGGGTFHASGQTPAVPDLTIDRLIDSDIELLELPNGIDRVVVARWSLAPTTAPVLLPATSLVVVESGELTGHHAMTMRVYGNTATPGAAVHEDMVMEQTHTYGPGEQFAVYSTYDLAVRVSNQGIMPVEGVIVSLLQERTRFPQDSGISFTPIVDIADGPGLGDYTVSLARLSYPDDAEHLVSIENNANAIVIIESGILNIQASATTLHHSAGSSVVEPFGDTERIPGEHFNLLTGDWLLSGPGTVATRNVERGPTTALVLTLQSTENEQGAQEQPIADGSHTIGSAIAQNSRAEGKA